MKEIAGIFVVFFLVLYSVSCVAKDISGIYDGEHAIITIKKINEAWEMNCVSDHSSIDTYTFLWNEPFKGHIKFDFRNYMCTPRKRFNKDIYSVSIKKKGNYKCGLFTNMFGKYDKQYDTLNFETKNMDGAYMFFGSDSFPWIDMSMAQRRTADCDLLCGDYIKR